MSIKLFICLALLSSIAGQDHKDLIPKLAPNTFHELNGGIQQKDNSQNSAQDSTETEQSGRQQRIAYLSNSTTNLATNNDKNKVNKTENEVIVASSSQITSSRPYSQYEVTEKVIDIPDTRIPPGPIVPSYTVRPALNLGVPVTQTAGNTATTGNTATIGNTANTGNTATTGNTGTTDNQQQADNKTESPNKEDNIQNKKNKFSILHVNVEFDDKPNEVHENKVTGILKGIKEYLQNIHKGIYNGIHRFFHKHDDSHGRFKREAEKDAVKVV